MDLGSSLADSESGIHLDLSDFDVRPCRIFPSARQNDFSVPVRRRRGGHHRPAALRHFYLVGGLVAELVYVAMSPVHFLSTMPMGGASVAIMCCMGMHLMLRAEGDIEFKYFLWLFFI
jgi:hypothetical protein